MVLGDFHQIIQIRPLVNSLGSVDIGPAHMGIDVPGPKCAKSRRWPTIAPSIGDVHAKIRGSRARVATQTADKQQCKRQKSTAVVMEFQKFLLCFKWFMGLRDPETPRAACGCMVSSSDEAA